MYMNSLEVINHRVILKKKREGEHIVKQSSSGILLTAKRSVIRPERFVHLMLSKGNVGFKSKIDLLDKIRK